MNLAAVEKKGDAPVPEQEPPPYQPPALRGLRGAWLVVRSLLLWAASIIHFAVMVPLLILMAIFVDPRHNDGPQRLLCRNILRLMGVKFRVHCEPGFDPRRTCFLVTNHVNVFDPFVLYAGVPQFIRGLELEEHFRIPIYGWLMKRFGNVPVSRDTGAAAMKALFRRTKQALDSGVSLAVFPEGSRTRTGRVGPFKKGVFTMARHFGYPLTPVSIVGSYQFNRTGSWMVYPAAITVYLHATIETAGLGKDEMDHLVERVRAIVAAPVDASFDS